METVLSLIPLFLLFFISGYLVARISGKKLLLFITALVITLIIDFAGFLLSQLPFDYPTPPKEMIVPLIRAGLFTFLSVIAGGAMGLYFKNKGNK